MVDNTFQTEMNIAFNALMIKVLVIDHVPKIDLKKQEEDEVFI